jgi:hypothetical protein
VRGKSGNFGFSLCRRTSDDDEILRKEFQVPGPTPHYPQASTIGASGILLGKVGYIRGKVGCTRG